VRRAAVLIALLAAGCPRQAPPATTPTNTSAPSADLEARLKRLEEFNRSHAEAIEFLQKVYEQQKAQASAAEESEPDPDAIFAVDITKAVAAGQVEGPANALVTIVEAWDFG